MSSNELIKERLRELNRVIRSAELERRSITKKLATPDKTPKLLSLAKKICILLLEKNMNEEDYLIGYNEFMINLIETLSEEEKGFFKEFKNDPFYKYDELIKHINTNSLYIKMNKINSPIGKRKLIGGRVLKSQNTLNKILRTLWSAKLDLYVIEEIEELNDLKRKVLAFESGKQGSNDKEKFINLYKSGLKQKEIADELHVSLSTIKRWVKEYKHTHL